MLRPWTYADDLLPRFSTYTSADRLRARLRSLYPNLAALEDIALERGIDIGTPFVGTKIGAFTVLAPSRERYLDLVVDSDRTPEVVDEAVELSVFAKAIDFTAQMVEKIIALVKSAWGEEVFSPNETSAENNMSVIQAAVLCDDSIVLTGDAGRAALQEAATFSTLAGITLPGIDKIQVPHHGSRRNVSTEVLDTWLGPRLTTRPAAGAETFTAYISSAKEDTHHPRKSVIRGFAHRGGKVFATEGSGIRTQKNAPARDGWGPIAPLDYPDEQEE